MVDADRVPPRILITAGPTAEDIDPVRFITNRSTGRMGIAVAAAARVAGARPLLVLGPTHLQPPEGVETIRVRSAADMHRAVLDNLARCDALVMTAAVADYTPAEPLNEKLKKKDGDLELRLKRTPDILREVARSPERGRLAVFGFSLDVNMNIQEGKRKLEAKNLDAIIVNATDTFGSDRIDAILLDAKGNKRSPGAVEKQEFAAWLISLICKQLEKKWNSKKHLSS